MIWFGKPVPIPAFAGTGFFRIMLEAIKKPRTF
jgi:hypothetical protein